MMNYKYGIEMEPRKNKAQTQVEIPVDNRHL